jgi:hypothetical protein
MLRERERERERESLSCPLSLIRIRGLVLILFQFSFVALCKFVDFPARDIVLPVLGKQTNPGAPNPGRNRRYWYIMRQNCAC